MKRERGMERTIRGTVFPVEWDENDNVVQVVIDTPGQEGYLVHQNKKGRELLEFIRREVEISGSVREDEDGDLIIKVKEFRLIRNND